MTSEEVSDEEWIREKIQWAKESISSTLARWDKVVPSQIPSTFFGLGLKSSSIALYNLVLGEREEALSYFKKASEYFDKSVGEERSGFGMREENASVCRLLLHSAILSCDESIIKTAVDTCLATDEKFPSKHRGFATVYYYNITLSNILAGNMDQAIETVDKVNYRPGRLKNLLTGDRKSLEAIIQNDRSLFLEGLKISLSYQAHSAGKDPGPADEKVCVPALVHIRVAHMNGMDIQKEEIDKRYYRFIPWYLFS